MNLNVKNRHAELGSASHKSKANETLKRVQGDTLGLSVNFLDASPLKVQGDSCHRIFKKATVLQFLKIYGPSD